MSSILIELWSNEESNTVRFRQISSCSSFSKSLNALHKQNLYQIMLSLGLNLQISVLFLYK